MNIQHVLLLLRILVLFFPLHLGIENGEESGKALQKMNK